MTKIFVSYQSQDRPHAQKLAGALTERGFDVWWDHNLLAGDDFRKTILKQLEGAGAVVVIWSTSAIASPWVMDEADTANEKRRLVPVKFDSDFKDIPIGFRSIQVQDLSGWDGDSRAPVIQAIEKKIEEIERGVFNETMLQVGQSMIGGKGASADLSAIVSSLSTSVGGMPLPRFVVGSLLAAVVAMAALAAWNVLVGGLVLEWLGMIPIAWIAAMALRAGHQYLVLASGRSARHYFDSTFSFWLIVCPLLATIAYTVVTPSERNDFFDYMPAAAIVGGAAILGVVICLRIFVHLMIWLFRKLD